MALTQSAKVLERSVRPPQSTPGVYPSYHDGADGMVQRVTVGSLNVLFFAVADIYVISWRVCGSFPILWNLLGRLSLSQPRASIHLE